MINHPVADLFPMLAEDELRELAADIAERGLLQPVVLDTEGRVLDGRNRLAACEIAGIEPSFMTYEGDDPDGYALAVNIARRHLTKGQQAIVIARADRLFNLYSQSELARKTHIPQARFSQAKAILDHAPDLADSVVSGAISLDKAYEQAQKNKKDAESIGAKLAKLRVEAPDLAADVLDEDKPMTLDEAMAALRAREAQLESERRAAIANLTSVLLYLTSTSIRPRDLARDYAVVLDEFKQDDLDYAAATMSEIAALKEH